MGEKSWLLALGTNYSHGIQWPRACLITFFSASSTVKTSSMVDSRPRENRTNELARLFSTPIANMTCDGLRAPEAQAEPLEAQMPSKSRLARRVALSQPSTVKATVFERRLFMEPRN